MTVVVLSHEEDFYAAIDVAETSVDAERLPDLASPLGAAVHGLTMDAWDAVRSALERVWIHGGEVLAETVASTTRVVQNIVEQAGDSAREVRAGITARLHVYMSEYVNRSLQRVAGTIEIEGASLRLTGVSVAQSLQLSGSLKASLSEVLAIAAEGQILITAEYGPL